MAWIFSIATQDFHHVFEEIKKNSRPVLVEVITERFRGHSISDPAVYRSKEELSKCMEKDPILTFYKTLSDNGMITEAEYEKMDKEQKEIVVAAMKFAEESPWPDPITLGRMFLHHRNTMQTVEMREALRQAMDEEMAARLPCLYHGRRSRRIQRRL